MQSSRACKSDLKDCREKTWKGRQANDDNMGVTEVGYGEPRTVGSGRVDKRVFGFHLANSDDSFVLASQGAKSQDATYVGK